jgi:hypothetical protein
MTTHPMSPVDAAWYHMDGPANRAIVTAIATTPEPLAFARVRRDFQRRLLHFDRFRQRVGSARSPDRPIASASSATSSASSSSTFRCPLRHRLRVSRERRPAWTP